MKAIEKAFGFAFPRDLRRFHSIARKHRDALFEAGVEFAGPLAMLDGSKLEADLGRWASDPPEFFTVADGNTDGLHWGWVLHEPGKDSGHVAWFYARDGYPIESVAPDLTHAIHYQVRMMCEGQAEELAEIRAVGEDDKELARGLAKMRKLEAALRKAIRKPARFAAKKERGATLDGIGVRAPKTAFAKISKKKRSVDQWLALGAELIAEGKAGSAAVIARDVLAMLPTEKQDRAVLLAVEAYTALGKPLLARTFEHRLAGIRKRVKAKKPPKIDNEVSVTMEMALADPRKVRTLSLSVWDDEPSVPDLEVISTFANVETIVLRGYPIGDLPKSFAKLKKLRSIELFECKLERLPAVLAKLKLDHLEIIQSVTVERPRKELRIPRGLRLPTLRSLHLVACGLRSVPSFVFGAKKLAFLDINGNHLRELPEALGDLRQLGYLNASENSLADLPGSLSKCTKLDSLWVSKNRIAIAPEVIGELTLKTLDIGKNPLVKNTGEKAKLKKLARKAKIYFT